MSAHWLSSAITERARFLAPGASGVNVGPLGRCRAGCTSMGYTWIYIEETLDPL